MRQTAGLSQGRRQLFDQLEPPSDDLRFVGWSVASTHAETVIADVSVRTDWQAGNHGTDKALGFVTGRTDS